jgi:hypothetical protein
MGVKSQLTGFPDSKFSVITDWKVLPSPNFTIVTVTDSCVTVTFPDMQSHEVKQEVTVSDKNSVTVTDSHTVEMCDLQPATNHTVSVRFVKPGVTPSEFVTQTFFTQIQKPSE